MNAGNLAAVSAASPVVAKPSAISFGFDFSKLCNDARSTDGSVGELPHPDSKPLPSIDKLPSLVDGLELLRDQLIALEPRDQVVKLKSLQIDPATGYMFRNDKPAEKRKLIAYTPTAVTHTCAAYNSKLPAHLRLPRSPGANLLYYPSPVRAAMVDAIRERLSGDREVKARVLCFGGAQHPILRALVTETHTGDQGDLQALVTRLVGAIAEKRIAVDDAKIHVSWSWDSQRAIIYFGTDRTGARACAEVTLSETKAHSWGVRAGVIIYGRTIWGWEPAHVAHGRHVGTKVANRMVDGIVASYELREDILQALEIAGSMPCDTATSQRAFLAKFHLPALELADPAEGDTVHTLLTRLYDVENFQPMAGETRRELREALGRTLCQLRDDFLASMSKH